MTIELVSQNRTQLVYDVCVRFFNSGYFCYTRIKEHIVCRARRSDIEEAELYE